MHNKRLWPFLLAIVLSLTYFFAGVAFAVSEDLTTYTEVDGNNRISVDATTANVTALTKDEDAYVYKDFGASYFDASFSIDFEFTATRTGDWGVGTFAMAGLANTVDDWRQIEVASGNELMVVYRPSLVASYYWMLLIENDGGTEYSDSTDASLLSYSTKYYYTFVRDDNAGSYGEIYLYIYSDAGRTTLLDTLTVALHSSKKDYRYLYAVQSADNNESGVTGTGQVANLEVSSAVGTPIIFTDNATDIAYDSVFGYTATLNGGVTDDGDESAYCSFYYKDVNDEDWSWASTAGSYATGENFTADINHLTIGHTYEFYAIGYNSAGTDTGDTLEFTVDLAADVPTIYTLAYPFTYDRDTDTASLYGEVFWDGNSSSNVTGWIQYKESSSETWLNSSANVTDLVTADTYSVNVTGLSIKTWYDFRAAGQNAEGNGYGNPSSFYIGDNVTAPTMTTGNVTQLTDTDCRIWGTVTDNGSGNVFAYFQYRISGTSSWIQTDGAFIPEGTTYSKLIDLIPDTNYEYRAVGWTEDDANFERLYGYGTTKTFASMTSISIPIISTDNVTYLSAGVVDVKGTVVYDGGSPVSLYFQAREVGSTDWTTSDYRLEGYTSGEQGSWYISGLENNHSYQARAVGTNYVGTGYGNIITFVMNEDLSGGGTTPETAIGGFADWVRQVRESLGMTGTMGTWAFMGLVLLIIAMIFGASTLAVKDSTLKIIIASIWGLLSISVVGAFVFSGELGVWPILVLVGAFVFFTITIVSVKLSGGGGAVNG